MTLDSLIAEGRRLERPSYFLKPHGAGEPVAMWLQSDPDDESITHYRRWITLRADALPNATAPASVFFSVYTGPTGEEGVIDIVDCYPPVTSTPLYAHPATVLPPLDAVFAFGSDDVACWLASHGWPRTQRPNGNFPERNLTQEYERLWMSEHPAFHDARDVYAVTGGWHMPTQWQDWRELAPAKLLVTTIREAEPWIEAFQLPGYEGFKVIARIT